MYTDQDYSEILFEEIRKSYAPVSGYLVACVIITEKGQYSDHNYEHENPVLFEHAEMRVLDKILKKEKQPTIEKIIMLGGGKVQKHKYYIPCFSCFQKLSGFTTPKTVIELLPIKNVTVGLSVTFGELAASYEHFAFSKIGGSDIRSITAELVSKTILHGQELDCCADLTDKFRQLNVGLYLTGSATGRGAASTLILSKINGSYRDVDLVVIVKKDQIDDVARELQKIFEKHYGKVELEPKAIAAYNNLNGVVIRKTLYHCGESSKQLYFDVTFATDFEGSFHYHTYKLRNWFHQLS